MRRALWRRGLRYRVCDDELPGKPDVVFPRYATVVFVDGDYWHGNQWRSRGFKTLRDAFAGISNGDYWVRKIDRNMKRDRKVTRQLRRDGWKVIRVWESRINRDVENTADQIARRIRNGA